MEKSTEEKDELTIQNVPKAVNPMHFGLMDIA